jgi:hopanoid biosynthesis associated RND transporter like protein HpnN
MKALSADSFLARLLAWLAAAVCRHPRWFVWPQAVLFVMCVFFTVAYLQFDINRDDLVGSNKKNHQNFLAFKKEFPQPDDLVVVIESEDIEKNRQFAERLGAKLEAETNLFRNVFFRQDLSMGGTKALLLASNSDVVETKKILHDDLPFIQKFTTATNFISFFEQINTQFRTASRETNAQTESLVQSLPALESIVRQATDSLERPGTPPSPGVMTLFAAGNEAAVTSSYITFNNGKIFLVISHPPDENPDAAPPVLGDLLKNAVAENIFHRHVTSGDLTSEAIDRLRQLVNDTKTEVPGLNIGVTGESVLDNDEMTQSQKDTMLASVVALVLCALIFIYGYNSTGRPIKATICLMVGLAYTLAFATLTVGHLNILTITFVPILIGLAIDFGVHLVTRYEEELRHGKTAEQALTKAMVFTGQGIITGALTTAGAFLAMAFTNFKGIQEMGIICGGGLIVCLVPMMTLLPVLLLRGRQNVIDHKGLQEKTRARIENLWLQRPAVVTAFIVVSCGVAALQLFQGKIKFDYNLLNMQSAGLPAVEFGQKLIDSGQSVLFSAVVANSLEEATALESRLRALTNVVSKVDSVAGFLRPDPDENSKLALIAGIKEELAPLKFDATDMNPVDISDLSRTLYGFSGYLGSAIKDVRGDDPNLAAQFTSLQQAILDLRKTMLDGDTNAHAAKLAAFQQAFFSDVRQTFQLLQQQDDFAPLRVEDLPAVLRNRFVGVTGKFLLQVYPKNDVWQRDNQKKFIEELRTVDPDVTGTPVQLYEYTSLLVNSYITAAWYSLIAIAILVFFHFRSIGAVILSLLPVVIGVLWLVGMMGWFGIPFNPANIMTLPLVIGIGVTNGIHILNRFAEEHTPGILSRSTGKAVLVSGLTAIAGFGSLMLAKHRGIHSLGFIMATGIAACMIAALTFLPALLNLLGRWRPLIKIKKSSVSKTSPTLD